MIRENIILKHHSFSGCTPVSCTYDTGDPDSKDKNVCFATNASHSNNEVNLKFYTCVIEDQILSGENGTHKILRNGSFSEAATLFYGTGEQAVYHLYSKNTHKQFSYTAMIIMLIINFLLSCYTAGTFLSCGIVVPMLLIGRLYRNLHHYSFFASSKFKHHPFPYCWWHSRVE